jgi:hypothetical protein
MKAFLMYRGQDLDLGGQLPPNEEALTKDLELSTLFSAMAMGDSYIYNVVRKIILTGTNDLDTIRYRQSILKDCLKNSSIVRQIYQIPIDSIENRQRHWLGVFSSYPSGILSGSIELMEMFVGLLKRLKNFAVTYAGDFESEGFRAFFAMIKHELDDEYFAIVQDHLKELRFNNGVLLSAELGKGNEGTGFVLRKPPQNKSYWKRIFTQRSEMYSFNIHPRDDHGARALAELKETVINLAANSLAQSTDHIDSFFKMLRMELAFYVGCLNLYERLIQMEEPITFPVPAPPVERKHSFTSLYDVTLALTMGEKVVGNDINADRKDLMIITGANQGGKSVFLRSIGLAQLMMQCGLFVPAEFFSANICTSLFTHYKRREDAAMESGKLDEELSRMSEIVDQLSVNSMVLFNESFAATNEREGSEIARQVTNALLEEKIKVFFVTHQYEFAYGFFEKKMDNAIFLRANRRSGGVRTFKLTEGRPLQTSFGKDLYFKLFEAGDRIHSA